MLEPPIICTCILTWSTLSYADSMWSILNCSSAIISSFSFLMSSLSFLVFLSSSSVEATFYKWRKISQLVIHMKNYTCCCFKLLFTVQKGAFSVPRTSAIEHSFDRFFSHVALYYLLWNKQTNWHKIRSHLDLLLQYTPSIWAALEVTEWDLGSCKYDSLVH